jgi:exonuclease VII small subunit|tara:strand:+ start:337 stop:567 length:231 start_codon:yes stop_codon:yes gene_type:complete
MKSKIANDEVFQQFTKNFIKVVDKLEQRISKLEKVLSSHAKCIGELRGTELRIHDLKDNQFEINADGTETTKDSIL